MIMKVSLEMVFQVFTVLFKKEKEKKRKKKKKINKP